MLIQRGFVAVNDGLGNRDIALLMTPPLPLHNGKAAWHLYSAAADFFPLLWEKGHRGIAITHYGFDRVLFDALVRKMRQRHELHHSMLATSGGPNAQLLGLTDWVLVTDCGNHDAQNGLKWGAREIMDEPESLLKDIFIFIVLESLRNGYSYLHDNLRLWLLKVVKFGTERFDKDVVNEYWRALVWRLTSSTA